MKREDTSADIGELESALGYRFQRPGLLQQALTHSSLANERNARGEAPAEDNEQLEFLGDSVLGFVTSDVLFQRFPHFQEGQLSKWRAHLVSARHLLKVAHELHLDRFVMLGKGEELSGGRHKSAILTDAVEAVIGAVYLDAGLEAARILIMEKVVAPELARMTDQPQAALAFADYKSALQEFLQARGIPQPSYSVVAEEGPAHRKRFTIEVRAATTTGAAEAIGKAEGATKKKAEQQAARMVLEELEKREGMKKPEGENGGIQSQG